MEGHESKVIRGTFPRKFYTMIDSVAKLFGGTPRSPAWRYVRDDHIDRYPNCAACGRDKKLQVHHVVPFSCDPSLELDSDNLLTLCDRCHLLIGHGGAWAYHNEAVRTDVQYIKSLIARRKSCTYGYMNPDEGLIKRIVRVLFGRWIHFE